MTLHYEALRSAAHRGALVDAAASKLLDVMGALRKGANRDSLLEVWKALRASTQHRSARVEAMLLKMADREEARFRGEMNETSAVRRKYRRNV